MTTVQPLDPHAEIATYWRGIIATLAQRGLLQERSGVGGIVLPEADAILLPDRVIFVLDMQRLGGIARECWLDRERLWPQWQATLQGRRVFVTEGNGLGLAITVAREPGQRRALPKVLPLALEMIPPEPYSILLGESKRGRLVLDLADAHRAILTGGASGCGKTNLMQAIVLELAIKHPPAEVQFAIVDTKQVDFANYAGLPHLFAPIAHTLEEATQLIERVEGERVRRTALMTATRMADWRRYNVSPLDGEPLPLLLLVVDEAADFANTSAMTTLIEIARKGRAFGISLIVGTQNPTAKVIDAQVRANLPTTIAFQTRTHVESQVILGCGGAEALKRPGLALAFLYGRWETIQTVQVTEEVVQAVLHRISDQAVGVPMPSALNEIEIALVRYAVERLGGCFKINELYQVFKGRISKPKLERLARQWQNRGWLTAPAHATDPRRVTEELLKLLPPALSKTADRLTGGLGADREAFVLTRGMAGGLTGDVLGGNGGNGGTDKLTGAMTDVPTERDRLRGREI